MTETNGNALITSGNGPVTLEHLADRVEHIIRQLDHLDDVMHQGGRDLAEVKAVLDEHRPLLERARALLDPGSKISSFMNMKKGSRNVR